MTDERVAVLIVGGGGAGLSASMLLSTYGVDSLLVSALPTTSVMPKAHVLNQRTMEVFREAGVADAIYEVGCPPEQMSHTAWYLDVAGHPDAGRRIAKLQAWGAGYTDPAWVRASPCRQTNLPQIRLEPLLRARAEQLCPEGVRFGNELISFEQDEDRVVAQILERETGRNYTIEADYLLGCDGGRTVGSALGVELEGQRDVMRSVSIHMTADLSSWTPDEDVLVRWIVHPRHGERFSVLVPMGPTRWGPSSEEWVFHMNYPPSEEHFYDTDAKVLEAMRERMGLPDLDPQVHVVTRWSMEGLLAPVTRVGRTFLLGDAAHRHPPTGGLGLNSAVHDAYNLAWKVREVLAGRAGDDLLDTYHLERFPVNARNTTRSVENALNHARLINALGVYADAPAEKNLAHARAFFAPDSAGEALRDAALAVIASQSMEFNEHNVEYGLAYESAAIVSDGTPPVVSVDDVRVYEPSTRPGSPVPHAWVERRGERRPLREIAPPGAFLLIAGETGEAWCAAAHATAARHGVELVAVRVGHQAGDWLDPQLAFVRHRGFGPDGAILVRPDRVVAWRAMTNAEDPAAQLDATLRIILGLAKAPAGATTVSAAES